MHSRGYTTALPSDNLADNLMRVYYLGPKGTFTYQAARQHFDVLGLNVDYVPVVELADLPGQLCSSDSDYAVIPFENSTNGHVVPTLDVLRDLDDSCWIVGEIYLTVHQCLLGNSSYLSSDTTPLRDRLSVVKRIYSHLQAFGQCESFLARHGLDKVERVNVDSTGKAAQLCAQDLESVAIGSAVSARPTTDAVVIAHDIEDNHDNTTRFLVLQKVKPALESGVVQKSLLRVTVAHDTPGALARILSEFASHGINLTSIASRPLDLAPTWRYVFFVEFQGGPGQQSVDAALSKIEQAAETARLLGTFEDRR